MKYIITESKLEKTIMNYFDELFDDNNITSFNPMENDDETGEEWENKNVIIFHDEGESADKEYDECFTWFDCDYFDPNDENSKYCPIVSVDDKYIRILDGYFGDSWLKPFKKWFEYHFHLPVNAVS